jgi:hypothetical protein
VTDRDQRQRLDEGARGGGLFRLRLFEGERRFGAVRSELVRVRIGAILGMACAARRVLAGDLPQQHARHRAAENAAHHEAESCAGDRGLRGGLEPVVFGEYLAPCRTGAMAAGQRDRADQQAVQRINA